MNRNQKEDLAAAPPGRSSSDRAQTRRTLLVIPGMDCPTEEGMIRKKLEGMPGVEGLDFDLLKRQVSLLHQPEALEPSLKALRSIDLEAQVAGQEPMRPTGHGSMIVWRRWALLAVAAVFALSAEILSLALVEGHWLVIVLSFIAIGVGGLKTYWKGVIALKNRTLNINALMTLAVTGALAIRQWPEAAMVMVLFAIAEAIESYSLDRARHAVQQLMAMTPELAAVRQNDGSWEEVPAKSVAVGAIARVRPGERIPLDGLVTTGASAVNQAPITGESVPVEKGPEDQVFAGTINQTGSFEFRVTKAADDSTLARIIHAVEKAQASRAPTQRFVDRFARFYTPAIFGLAVLVALVPPLVFGQPYVSWLYRALVLLVIGCPCALVISTPVTVVSGLASAARRGILIKGGAYLEQGRRLKAIAFDKTGTVTKGEPQVTDFIPMPGQDGPQVLSWAASLAVRSDHPLSQAVAFYAEKQSTRPSDISEFSAAPGRGTEGRLDGRWIGLGSHRMIDEKNACDPAVENTLRTLEDEGKTAVLLADEDRVLAVFGIADTVRDSSRTAVEELHRLGVRTTILSGDNQQTVTAIAAQTGIDDARGNLLPEEKVSAIEELVRQYGQVGMAGDGINDAPALAVATIGFAMGVAGSDTALETADVALMDDDLRKLPVFLRLSRRTAVILRENIALALGIKAVFLGLAVAGRATLWMAVLADMGASLLVVFNGLRLLQRERGTDQSSERVGSPAMPLEAPSR